MKTSSNGNLSSGHQRYPPKLRMSRTRTWSSDSGCDLHCDSPNLTSILMEDALNNWTFRLEEIVRQKVEKVKDLTTQAKESLKNDEEDEYRRELILKEWRRQFEDTMETTKDMIECVNNETKEGISESMEQTSGHESTSIMEEIEEKDDDAAEHELMELLLLSVVKENNIDFNPRKEKLQGKKLLKEFMKMYKKNGKKGGKNICKKSEGKFVKRRPLDVSRNVEPVDIFYDWLWNLKDINNQENGESLDLSCYKSVENEICKETLESNKDDNRWSNCKFWQITDDNENILHCLINNDLSEETNKEVYNFWDENYENHEILKSLIENENFIHYMKDVNNFWDENYENQQILKSLIEEESTKLSLQESIDSIFSWEAKDIAFSLIEMDSDTKPMDEVCMQPSYFWEHGSYLESLINFDEKSDDWSKWNFWKNIGSKEKIIEAFDELYGQEVMEDVKPDKIIDNKKEIKEGLDLNKDFENVFGDVIEDLFLDWMGNLSDIRCEKKRQQRGRKKLKKSGKIKNTKDQKPSLDVKRPGTPNIQTYAKVPAVKSNFNFDTCWIETKVPKKERKAAHVWKNARSQKKLNAKIHPKQPRSS